MAIPDELVDLIATQTPEASPQGTDVVVTARVTFANTPATEGQIRLAMTWRKRSICGRNYSLPRKLLA